FFFQAEDGIRDFHVTGVQTCALPILEAGLNRESREVETKIQYVRDAIRPARTRNAAELMAPTLAKVTADLDLLCATLNSSRASEIGRASCRERGSNVGEAGAGEQEMA